MAAGTRLCPLECSRRGLLAAALFAMLLLVAVHAPRAVHGAALPTVDAATTASASRLAAGEPNIDVSMGLPDHRLSKRGHVFGGFFPPGLEVRGFYLYVASVLKFVGYGKVLPEARARKQFRCLLDPAGTGGVGPLVLPALFVTRQLVYCQHPQEPLPRKSLDGLPVSLELTNEHHVLPSSVLYQQQRALTHEQALRRQLPALGTPVHQPLNSVSIANPSAAGSSSFDHDAQPSYQHELCACLTLYNRGYLLPEWLQYHHMLGLAHTRIYDNDSSDRLRERVAFLGGGYSLDYVPWPEPNAQDAFMVDCALSLQDTCAWVMMTDLDEFVHLQEGDGRLDTYLGWLRRQHQRVGGVKLESAIFQSHEAYEALPPGGLIRNYVCRKDRNMTAEEPQEPQDNNPDMESAAGAGSRTSTSAPAPDSGGGGGVGGSDTAVDPDPGSLPVFEKLGKMVVNPRALHASMRHGVHWFTLRREYTLLTPDRARLYLVHYKALSKHDQILKYSRRVSTKPGIKMDAETFSLATAPAWMFEVLPCFDPPRNATGLRDRVWCQDTLKWVSPRTCPPPFQRSSCAPMHSILLTGTAGLHSPYARLLREVLQHAVAHGEPGPAALSPDRPDLDAEPARPRSSLVASSWCAAVRDPRCTRADPAFAAMLRNGMEEQEAGAGVGGGERRGAAPGKLKTSTASTPPHVQVSTKAKLTAECAAWLRRELEVDARLQEDGSEAHGDEDMDRDLDDDPNEGWGTGAGKNPKPSRSAEAAAAGAYWPMEMVLSDIYTDPVTKNMNQDIVRRRAAHTQVANQLPQQQGSPWQAELRPAAASGSEAAASSSDSDSSSPSDVSMHPDGKGALPTFYNVVHVVLHPLRAIGLLARNQAELPASSLERMTAAAWHVVDRHEPPVQGAALEERRVLRALRFWVLWHRRIQRSADAIVRLDDARGLALQVPALLRDLGMHAPREFLSLVEDKTAALDSAQAAWMRGRESDAGGPAPANASQEGSPSPAGGRTAEDPDQDSKDELEVRVKVPPLRVTWEQLERLDPWVASEAQRMAVAFGYADAGNQI